MKLTIPETSPIETKYKSPGSNKGQAAVARTNATNQAIYANAANAQSYQKGLQDYYLDKLETDVMGDIKDAQSRDQYRSVMQQRDIQIQGNLQAYQRNASNVADQLRLNREAALRADRQAGAVLNDRLKAESYKLEELNLNRAEELTKAKADFKDQSNAYAEAEKDFLFAKQFNAFQAGQDIQEIDFAEAQQKQAFIEERAGMRNARSQLVRNYNQATNEATFQYDQVSQDFNELKAAKQFEKGQANRQFDQLKSAERFKQQSLQREFKQLESSELFKRQSLERQYKRNISQQDYVQDQAELQFKQQRAQAMFGMQQRMFKQVQDMGNQLSRGQRGRSAARGARSIAALAGVDLARFADQIDRAEDVYDLTKNRAHEVKKELGTEKIKQKARSRQIVREQRRNKNKAQQRSRDLVGEGLTNRDALKARSQELIDSGRTRRNSRRGRLQERLDEQRFDSMAKYEQSEKAEVRAFNRSKSKSIRSQQLKDNRTSLGEFANMQEVLKRDKSQAKANNNMNTISTITGLKAEAFSMDRRALGESMISALNAYESSKDDIWLKKMEGDMKAYASRMFEPQFTDAPKQPFKTPRFETYPPTVPLEVPKGNVAPAPKAPQRSGLSKMLQIGGMVLGAVAAPLTAGSSTLVAGAVVGGLGAGMSATSAFV